MEVDLAETRRRLEESNAVQTEALKRHADMQQELENNAGHRLLSQEGSNYSCQNDLRILVVQLPLWSLPAQNCISILDVKAVRVQ